MFESLDLSDLISLAALAFISGGAAILATFKIKFKFRRISEELY